ncbi:MAG: TetR/AcrR family transcriptional regulator [Anaerolineaceae bacterium]|nr:TetR/AcrR family transcriptional regulator [Anaerolineaceae bacterium]
MPKGFTEHEKELISKRLIEQGYKLFSAYGLKKTNVEEIAQAAGISKGAFYLFYESKEALFMDVTELAERQFRQQVLAAVDQPGPSPRARFLAVLQVAFSLVKTIPVLQFITSGDYDILFRRVPPEKLQQHLAADRTFFEELFARCAQAGIPIKAHIDDVTALLYAVILAYLHEDDLGRGSLGRSMELQLELIAAFCVGEIDLQAQKPAALAQQLPEGTK